MSYELAGAKAMLHPKAAGGGSMNSAERLRLFAEFILSEWPDGVPDTDEVQDKAVELGLLEAVSAAEPCGDMCFCAEYYGADEWPVTCYRRTQMLVGGRDIMKAENLRPAVTLSFTVYGSPIAQPRQRHAMRGRGEGAHVINYTPAKHPVQQWKYNVAQTAFAAFVAGCRAGMLTGPLFANITIYLPRPKKYNAKHYEAGPMPHSFRPDRDNLEKAILDALKGVVFVDDCQVCAGEVMKFYHEKDGRPRAEITIGELP